MQIRVAAPADAELLADLGARTLRDTFGPDKTEAQAGYLALTFNAGLKSGDLADPNAVFLIAEVKGAAVAYARLRFGFSPEFVGGLAPVEIARIYADAPWIGRGAGKALMKCCLAMAKDRDCDMVWLDVWEKNHRAIRFYKRWGFTAAGSQAPGWITMKRPALS
ncbi:MAG: GNAT family N-acetyltransferase [Thermoleophilia bacterium]|nr:GNAT family N-acetyltransferase [Thermoleophilia bacterium]